MPRNLNVFKSAFLAFTDSQKLDLFERRRAKVQTALDQLSGYLATSGEGRLPGNHTQRATYQGYLQTYTQQLQQAVQRVETDNSQARTEYDGLADVKATVRGHAETLGGIVDGLPTAWDLQMMDHRSKVDDLRDLDTNVPGFKGPIEAMLDVETRIDQAAEAWDFDIAAGLLPTLGERVMTVETVQEKHKLYADRISTVRLRYQTIANTDIPGVPALVEPKNKVAKEAKTTEELGLAGKYVEALVAMSGPLNTAIVKFEEAAAQAYTTAQGTLESRWTTIESLTRPEKESYSDFTTAETAWKDATDAATRSEWVVAAEKLLVEFEPAVKALEEAQVEAKKQFDATVGPLRVEAEDAKTKSDGMVPLETRRSRVISEESVIKGRESSKLYVAAKALLPAWKLTIKALAEALVAKTSFDNAIVAPRRRMTKAAPEKDTALSILGRYAATSNTKRFWEAVVAADNSIKISEALGSYATAEGLIGAFESALTDLENELAREATGNKRWILNEHKHKFPDLKANLAQARTRATGMVDKDSLITEVQGHINVMDTKVASGPNQNYTLAWRACNEGLASLDKLTQVIRQYEVYKARYKSGKTAYDDIMGKTVDLVPLRPLHQLAERAHTAVTDKEQAGEYGDATGLLTTLATKVADLAKAFKEKGEYDKAAESVYKKVRPALLVPTPDPVETVEHPLKALHTTLNEKKTAVEDKVESASFADATALLPDLDAAASAVLKAGTLVLATSTSESSPTSELQDLQGKEGGDELLAGVTEVLLTKDEPTALQAALELQFGVTLTKTTEASTVTWTASPGDVEATSLKVMYELLFKTQYTSAVGPLRNRFNDAKSKASSISPMDTARDDMESAERDVKAKEDCKEYATATKLLPDFEAKIVVVEQWLGEHKAYTDAIKDVDIRHDKALLISVPPPPYADEPDIVKTKEAMVAAKKLVTDDADAGKYTDATGRVDAWNTAVNEMFAQQAFETARTNPSAAVDALDGLSPDGPKVLDAFIKDLDSGHPKYNEIMEAALKKRFKLNSLKQLDNKKDNNVSEHAEDVKHMYELFLKVPEEHTRDNTALTDVVMWDANEGGAAYSYYRDRVDYGKVKMYCGRPKDSHDESQNLSTVKAFPDGVEEDYQLEDTEPVKYYDWAALHEVGHAIDHRKGFMAGKTGNSDFGGWTFYDSKAATAAALRTEFMDRLQFGFDDMDVSLPLVTHIDALLGGGTPARPVAPGVDVSKVQKWNEAFDEVSKIGGVDRSWSICYDGQSSKRAVIGKFVYQEASNGKWVRYRWSERQKGITGYQFRAPAEWFAELYAAHYFGKLKKSHPFNSVIENL